MSDMTSTSRAMLRAILLAGLSALALSGCKSATLSADGTAAALIADEQPLAATAGEEVEADDGAVAYTDPRVAVSASANEAMVGETARTLPSSEEPAENMAGLVTQPTGIKAGQASIFSATGSAMQPDAASVGAEGAMVSASAYTPAPGVNARLYSVYGSGTLPTGSSPSPME